MRIALDVTAATQSQLAGAGVYASQLARCLGSALGDSDELLLCTRLSAWPRRAYRPEAADPRVSHRWYLDGLGPRGGPEIFHALDDYVPRRMPGHLVVSVHDARSMLTDRFAPDDGYRAHHDSRYGQIARHADRVVFSSEYVRREYLTGFPEVADRDSVVHPGVDPIFRRVSGEEVASARRAHDLPDRFALYVGEVAPRKNLPAQARALALGAPGLPWVWLGVDGPDSAAVREEVAGITEVIDLGYRPRHELSAVYSAATLLTLVTKDEGYGLASLEAMACGLPIVVSRQEAVCELTGGCALEAGAESETEMAEAFGRIVSDEAFATELSRQGLDRAGQFTWERTAREVLEVYRKAAS